jgi:hypothetical protein
MQKMLLNQSEASSSFAFDNTEIEGRGVHLDDRDIPDPGMADSAPSVRLFTLCVTLPKNSSLEGKIECLCHGTTWSFLFLYPEKTRTKLPCRRRC